MTCTKRHCQMFHDIDIGKGIASDTNNSQLVPVISVCAYSESVSDIHGIYYQLTHAAISSMTIEMICSFQALDLNRCNRLSYMWLYLIARVDRHTQFECIASFAPNSYKYHACRNSIQMFRPLIFQCDLC